MKKMNHKNNRRNGRGNSPSTLVEFVHGRLTVDQSLEILDQIEQNPQSSMDLDLIVQILNEAADPCSDIFDLETNTQKNFLERMDAVLTMFGPRRMLQVVTSVFALLIILTAMIETPRLHRSSKFDEFTALNKSSIDWNIRGGNKTSDLVTAYQLFAEGEIDKSIDVLKVCARANSRSMIAAYAHYEAGAIYLLAARKSS